MAIVTDINSYETRGDKKNSDFFEEYKAKVYTRRQTAGLDDLLDRVVNIVVQVDAGMGVAYLKELYLMTPYRLRAAYQNPTHKIYFLESLHNPDQRPSYVVLEPLAHDYCDDMTRRNKLYPNAFNTPNARYVGEIMRTSNMHETKKILESHDVRFEQSGAHTNNFFNNAHFVFTTPSDYTANRFGYTETCTHDYDALQVGEAFKLDKKQQAELDQAADIADQYNFNHLILGIDHMATRIMSSDREDAILEFLTLSNYYFWGAYNIADMNSSTNVCRNPTIETDLNSPAKVFTANNTPFIVNSFEERPMPTETFVRNYGRRMHHIAYEILDGDYDDKRKNLDYVVEKLRDNLSIPFLAKVVGECTDEPNLKQIFSKHSELSLLITEYVERCHGYDGFFTKSNVAALTEAAGEDEALQTDFTQVGHVFD